jgi:plastocyanin
MDRSRLVVIGAAAVTAVASVAAVAAAITSDDDDDDDGTVAETPAAAGAVPVEIRDFAFGPPDAAVPVGGQVLWTNADGLAHSIAADDASFVSPDLDTGDSFPFTFAAPGTYPYHCGIHESMRGTVVVQG